jgi:putative transposase
MSVPLCALRKSRGDGHPDSWSMRKVRFLGILHLSEEQIAFALRQAESGTAVTEITRKFGVSERTFYRWKRKYAGLGVAELRRLKQVEEENRKLKQLVADLSLDKKMLQDVLSK